MKSFAETRTLLVGLALLPLLANALTYWVDISCTGKIPNTIEEAIYMARRASQRLADEHDDYFADIFDRLFNTDATDRVSLGRAQNVMYTISDLKVTLNQEQSDVRVYCDDDSWGSGGRWQVVPDIYVLPAGFPRNSERTRGKDQEFYDPINGMRTAPDILGCKTLSLNPLGVTYRAQAIGDYWSTENNRRSSITLCELGIGKPRSFNEIDDDANYDVDLDDYRAMTSFTMLHEFTHMIGIDTLDYAYDIVGCQSLFNPEALVNAQTYAYLGAFAVLADREWRWEGDRDRPGKLVYDSTLRKRMLHQLLAPRGHGRDWLSKHNHTEESW